MFNFIFNNVFQINILLIINVKFSTSTFSRVIEKNIKYDVCLNNIKVEM